MAAKLLSGIAAFDMVNGVGVAACPGNLVGTQCLKKINLAVLSFQ